MRQVVAASQFLPPYYAYMTGVPTTLSGLIDILYIHKHTPLVCAYIYTHISILRLINPEELKKIFDMGLSHFPTASEGVLPVLMVNIALSVSHLENMVRSMLQALSSAESDSTTEEDLDGAYAEDHSTGRRISITQFKSLSSTSSTKDTINSNTCTTIGSSSGEAAAVECCVCLSGFEAEEEVSELSCKHFFHKVCLDKWFDNNHSTCPLCRSID